MFGNWQKGQAGIGREYLSESRGWRVDFQIRFSDAYAILECLLLNIIIYSFSQLGLNFATERQCFDTKPQNALWKSKGT
ncbi:hypothetical protein QQP08_024907 [Theobroma cacao]|nr:hypothetical protein QQP08_024907 [Theobroma cacao]